MTDGIRATVAFDSDVCPVSETVARADARVDRVTTSVAADGTTPVTEFRVDADQDASQIELDTVFEQGGARVYRVDHADGGCPCELLGQLGCPVDRFLADEHTLTLVFHAPGYDVLRDSIDEIRSAFPQADVRQLIQSSGGDAPANTVVVDRDRLTDRQLEAVRTAYEMGYFDRPRGATAGEIATELDISPSTLTEHLATGQRKLFGDFLGETPQ